MRNDTYKLLIEFLRNALKGEGLPPKRENADIGIILEIANSHHVDNILFPLLKNINGFEQSQIGEKLKKLYILAITKEVNQQREADRVMKAFEENKIVHMPLKGYIIKNLYPSPDLRQSTDFDIYVPAKFNKQVCDVMTELGYSFNKESIGQGMHDNYHYGIYTEVEVHKSLMASDFPKWCKLCDELINNMLPMDGYGYRYMFTKEDYYIYMQLHTIKHLKYSSCGIKPIIDIWIYLKNYNDILDWRYINKKLCKYNLDAIEKNLRMLSDYWFEEIEPESKIIYDLSDYIIDSGAFGTDEQYLSGRKTDESKFGRMKRLVFLPVDEMKIKYPILKKATFLIPLYWIYRILNGIIFKRGLAKKVVNKGENIDNTIADSLSKFKKDLGL